MDINQWGTKNKLFSDPFLKKPGKPGLRTVYNLLVQNFEKCFFWFEKNKRVLKLYSADLQQYQGLRDQHLGPFLRADYIEKMKLVVTLSSDLALTFYDVESSYKVR